MISRNNEKKKSINFFFILGLYFALSFIGELIYQIQNELQLKYSLTSIYKTMAILLISLLLLIKFYKETDQIFKNRQFILVILFFFINIIASVVSFKIYGSISYRGIINIFLFIYNFIIFYILMTITKFDQMNVKLFFQFCIFNILLASCYNIIINFNALPKIFFSSSSAYEYNFSSYFGNRNSFAAYLTLGIVIYSVMILWTRESYLKVLRILACVFIFSNLLITLSRTSILKLFIFILIYFIFTNKITVKKKIIIFGLIFFIILMISSLDNESFIKSKLIRKNIGNTGRTKIWLTAILLPNHFFEILFGFGSGFRGLYLMQKSGHYSAHNAFLKVYTSGGIVALSAYVLVVVGTLIYNIKNIKKREIKILIFAFQIAYIVTSFFEADMLFASNAEMQLTTFLVVSLPLLLSQSNKSVKKDIMEKQNQWTKILLF